MEVVDNKDNLGVLRKLVAGAVSQGKVDQLAGEVAAVIAVSKDAGIQLGVILKGMRDQLKAKKRWYAVIGEIAKLTGFTDRTILRWVDGQDEVAGPDKMSDSKPDKKEFDGGAEIKSLAGRLAAKDYAFMDAAEQFLGRMLEKTGVASDAAGDAEFIERMTGLVQALAGARGLNVAVSIIPTSQALQEAA